MNWLLNSSRIRLTFVGLSAVCCAPSEEELQAEFDAYVAARNQCETVADCAVAVPGCPLGCFVYVNSSKVKEVEAKAKELVDDYERFGAQCEYGCVAAAGVDCEAHRCVAR